MKQQRFTGTMGNWMVQHLTLRRSLGCLYLGAEYSLNSFDQFLDKHYPDCKVITRQMVVGYLDTTHHRLPLTRAAYLSDLRQFCRYMLQFDLNTYIPERALVVRGEVQVKHYIFSKEDVSKVMQQVSQFKKKNKILIHTYQTIVGLLWVTGMRIGEVINLKIEDIDTTHNVLTIRKTKFYKSRMLPLTPSTTKKIVDYLKQRSQCGYDNSPSVSMFINNRGKPCAISATAETLRMLFVRAGLKTKQGRFPRVHDLRHSFATRWMEDIYQSGKDPNIYLPILATYLGHSKLAHTQVYLHPSTELLNVAGEKLQAYRQPYQEKNNEES
jgi:integrase/recombinase XerD